MGLETGERLVIMSDYEKAEKLMQMVVYTFRLYESGLITYQEYITKVVCKFANEADGSLIDMLAE